MSCTIIPRGFTLWDFNINTSSYRTFAWWGWLFIELDGEYLTINASGHAMGDKGDFCFRVHDSLTQEQLKEPMKGDGKSVFDLERIFESNRKPIDATIYCPEFYQSKARCIRCINEDTCPHRKSIMNKIQRKAQNNA